MATRIFAFIILAAMLAAWPFADTRAQQLFADGDGCAALATVIHEQVASSAWSFPGTPSFGSEDRLGLSSCEHTTRTVTASFSRAMASMNIYVTWTGQSPLPGDMCQSAFLSQCYPDRSPLVPWGGAAETAFMYDAWRGVYKAVTRNMPAGVDSDVSRFTTTSLRSDMQRSLSQSVNVAVYDY